MLGERIAIYTEEWGDWYAVDIVAFNQTSKMHTVEYVSPDAMHPSLRIVCVCVCVRARLIRHCLPAHPPACVYVHSVMFLSRSRSIIMCLCVRRACSMSPSCLPVCRTCLPYASLAVYHGLWQHATMVYEYYVETTSLGHWPPHEYC